MSTAPLDDDQLDDLALRIAARLRQPSERLLTVDQVAEMLQVRREWVYEHADDLRALRLGSGTRGRLRFDRGRVLDALAPAPAAVARPTRRPRRATVKQADLLPIGRKR